MIYLSIALALMAALAGWLGWRLWRTSQALHQEEARCKGLQKERALRENLQNMLDSRNAEARRLRGQLHALQDEVEAERQENSDLNLSLFHESSLRILREKEEGSRRMKMDLMEKQLDEANAKLRQTRQEARENAARLNEVINEQRDKLDQLNALVADQQAQIDQYTSPPVRRAGRRSREGLPNQVTLNDVMGS